jgi:arylsulfatase A-like enzyme
MKEISSKSLVIVTVILFFFSFMSFGQSGEKPNVVIFYADDLGWGDLSLNNKNEQYFRYTPNIDEICSQGVILENYVTHCVCSPSRAGLLTAKHYAKVMAGPRTGGELPYENTVTMGQDFQNSGYKTGCFGKWHNGEPNLPANNTGLLVDSKDDIIVDNEIYEYESSKHFGIGVNNYGFDKWTGYYGGGADLFHRFAAQQNQANWWVDSLYMGAATGYTTDLITDAAIEFINNNKDNNFLCYVAEQAVHHPIQVKKSDLYEYCDKLNTERGISGQWDYVKNIVSPTTGRTIEEAGEEIKCWIDDEFDLTEIDPGKTHFNHLIFGAYIYTLDKSIGRILDSLKALGLMTNTIIVFASDNGGLPEGCSLPFQGGKHSIWEGGVHVPAAIWWPEKFDANTLPYSPTDNKYIGNVGYYDIYPTLMAMTGNTFSATETDGLNFWDELQSNTQVRPGYVDPFFEIWDDHGFVRTDEWKLMYSETDNRKELYQYKTDITEANNVANSNLDITNELISLFKGWLTDNKLAVPFVKLDASNLHSTNPDPDGEILELKAWQTKTNNSGVFIRFAQGDFINGKIGHYIEPGDRVEYDIYVAEDSENSKGIYYSSGSGWTPVFNSKNGINQDSIKIHDQTLEKGIWIRNVVGTGTICPGSSTVNYIVFRGGPTGYYHFYLDNIVIRKSDGTVRSVIWQNSSDASTILYRFKNINHNSLSSALDVADFPFSDIQMSALKTDNESLILPIKKFIYTDVIQSEAHNQEFEIVNYTPQNVNISSINVGGDDVSFFEITSDKVSGTAISPMSKKTFTLSYDPGASGGDHKAFIRIDNDLSEDTIVFESNEIGPVIYRQTIDHCDESTGWASNNGLSLNNEDHREWGACLETTGDQTNEFQKSFNPPIETRATKENGYLQFWYYVSDVTKFDNNNQVEIGSGGKNDLDEFNWNLNGKVSNGWNLLKLYFRDAGISPSEGSPDLSAINWIRIYHWKTDTMTTRIDGFQIVDPSVSTSTETVDQTAVQNNTGFSLQPNPSNGYVRIFLHSMAGDVIIQLFDLQGRNMLEKRSRKEVADFDLSHLKKGIYIIKVTNGGESTSQKFVIG